MFMEKDLPVTGQYSLVLGIFLDQFKNNQPLTIVGDGEQRRDFVHVKDIAYANVLAAETEIDNKYYGQVFNVAGGKNISINELASMISNNKVHVQSVPGKQEQL
jgi:UDP-glucose 4-epimerase